MTDKEMDTKKKIIDATIQLIREEKDVNKITIRRITEKAGVATSMINYHFQTKKNLIDKAVQTYISSIITKGDNILYKLDLNPIERLKSRVKRAANYLAKNPGISKVSILSDLQNGNINDNSSQSIQSIYNQLKDIFGDKKDKKSLVIMSLGILATLQELFLRAKIIKEQMNMDYYNDEQRDQLIDMIINNILGTE